ncbi:EamA family transporter RarD [Nonomuraea sp. NBC_01738]|uniref:EamA family transporter RarD n=1 Tax=Nonomuraea sp. NBC_01738 TaxID=2976003 RepID=UPI002E0E113C|nr:EamA family transporter RarD [Nonomuraea sp. NBC_01738]
MPDQKRGVLFGIAAYVMWGLFPLYWPLLKPSGAIEILAHRMAWSLVVVVAVLAVRRHWSWVKVLLKQPRKLALLTLAAVLVTVNWGTYIYAVNTGHVVESALGYFINPLVSVLFGVVLLKERLRPLQWAAVGFGTLAVVVLAIDYGRLPWIALTLAISFGIYGLVKKQANVGAAESLTVETLVLLAPALAYLVYLEQAGQATFGHSTPGHALLLAGAGVITAIPLLFFTASAIRVPLSTIGLLQYIAPVLQFACGVLIAKETMPPSRWIGFSIVWLALAIFTYDSLRTARRTRKSARTLDHVVA